MDTLEGLRAARDLIALGWVQGQMVRRDEDGQHSYCTVGALRKVGGEATVLSRNMMIEMGHDLGLYNLIGWNDSRYRTHGQVLAAFDKTIRRLRLQQAVAREDEEVMLNELNKRVREKKKTLVAV